MANRRCAYCGFDGPLTLEHLWPTSLHRRLIDASDDKENQFWLRRLGREIEAEPKLRDVCAKCNNIFLSRLGAYICEVFDKYFAQMLAEMKFSADPWQLVRIVIAALFVGVPLLLAAMWLVLFFSR